MAPAICMTSPTARLRGHLYPRASTERLTSCATVQTALEATSLVLSPGDSIKVVRAFVFLCSRGRRMFEWQFRQSGPEPKEMDMDWNIVEGNWKQFKGKVKQQWGKLSDDHLDVIAGKRDELAGKIQESYGITKDEAEKQIKDFEERNKDARP
jgi:uncharacterized protein YjbJ (UPF0337 family)